MLNEAYVDFRTETKPGPFAYDAIWSSALTMNATLEDIKPLTLGNFTYGNTTGFTTHFRKHIEEVQFIGVSVRQFYLSNFHDVLILLFYHKLRYLLSLWKDIINTTNVPLHSQL